MKLTHYSDLGLRLMMYLTLRQGELTTIQAACDRFAVSKNHMVKVSHQLTKSGLIASIRGRNGGVRLARAPESISVEEVLRVTEDSFDLVECFGDTQNRCVISGACKLSGVLDEALAAFFTVLRQVSLADLVKNGRLLEKSLLPLSKPIQIRPRTRSAAVAKK